MKNIYKYKMMTFVLPTILSLALMTGCTVSGTAAVTADAQANSTANGAVSSDNAATNYDSFVTAGFDSDDEDTDWSISKAALITLSADSIALDGQGASVDGSTITITSAGTYCISGTINDGQIIVDAKDQIVRLVLNGTDITCSDSSPIYVKDAQKTVIILADGTQNKVTDAAQYILTDIEAAEPDAAIFSKSDLTINGTGSLSVVGNYKHGINSKDNLKILGGTITVDAVKDGIRGKDSIAVKTASVTVTAGTDGLQSNNSDDAAKGFICIESGIFNITAGNDGIQAETNILISGGTLTIAAGDDGIHSDTALMIGGGTITVTKSYEGLESAQITVNDGTLYITSSDDGFNAVSSTASSTDGNQMPNGMSEDDSAALYINGGYVVVDASGDGLDSNGSIYMTAGTVLVSGPTDNGNGTLDYAGSFRMTGGILVAAGSSGMAQAPDTTSTQNVVMINLDASQSAGTIFHIEDEDGADILTYAPVKQYNSIVLCSPALITGSTYKVYYGGSSTGAEADSLYSGGTYTPGTESTGFTISDTLTTVGTVSSMMGGGMAGGGGMPGGGAGGAGKTMPDMNGVTPGAGGKP